MLNIITPRMNRHRSSSSSNYNLYQQEQKRKTSKSHFNSVFHPAISDENTNYSSILNRPKIKSIDMEMTNFSPCIQPIKKGSFNTLNKSHENLFLSNISNSYCPKEEENLNSRRNISYVLANDGDSKD